MLIPEAVHTLSRCAPSVDEVKEVDNVQSSGDRFLPVNPLDTRSGAPLAVSVRHAQVAGVGGVPDDATAVVLNATSTQASSTGGFLTLFAKGTPTPSPLTSNLNYRPPFNAPNQAIARVGTEHSITLLNRFGTAHIILDASGYFVDSD